jgi:hypothetical protein
MTMINPNVGGGLPTPERRNAQNGTPDAAPQQRFSFDGLDINYEKLRARREQLDASRIEIPIAELDLITRHQRQQLQPPRAQEMAPMYGMPFRPDDEIEGHNPFKPVRPIDMAPMYGMPVMPGPIDGDDPEEPIFPRPRPIDMAPMYGMPVMPGPIDGEEPIFPHPRPIDIAPMYGMPIHPIDLQEPHPKPVPPPNAAIYGMPYRGIRPQ